MRRGRILLLVGILALGAVVAEPAAADVATGRASNRGAALVVGFGSILLGISAALSGLLLLADSLALLRITRYYILTAIVGYLFGVLASLLALMARGYEYSFFLVEWAELAIVALGITTIFSSAVVHRKYLLARNAGLTKDVVG